MSWAGMSPILPFPRIYFNFSLKFVFLLFISIGDVIKGTVTVELSESLDAEKLEIKCLGQARTLIRIYHR